MSLTTSADNEICTVNTAKDIQPRELASLSTSGLINKVKELHDIAYQLGVDEAKEITRGKYLNIFNKSKKRKLK